MIWRPLGSRARWCCATKWDTGNGWSGAHERQRSVREAAEADAKEAFPKLAHAIELRKSEFKKVASLRSPPRQLPPPWVPLVMLARLVFFTFGAY